MQGASAAGGTQVVVDAAGDIAQGNPVEIDKTKAALKAVEGGVTAALATALTVGVLVTELFQTTRQLK